MGMDTKLSLSYQIVTESQPFLIINNVHQVTDVSPAAHKGMDQLSFD